MLLFEKIALGTCAAISTVAVAASGYHLWWRSDESRVNASACATYEEALDEIFAPVAAPENVHSSLTASDCRGGHTFSFGGSIRVYISEMTSTEPEDFETLRELWEDAIRDPRLLPLSYDDAGVVIRLVSDSYDVSLGDPDALTLGLPRHLSQIVQAELPIELDAWGAPRSPLPGEPGSWPETEMRLTYDASSSEPFADAEEAWSVLTGMAAELGGYHRLVLSSADDSAHGNVSLTMVMPADTPFPQDFSEVIAELERISLELDDHVSVSYEPGPAGWSIQPAGAQDDPILEAFEAWGFDTADEEAA